MVAFLSPLVLSVHKFSVLDFVSSPVESHHRICSVDSRSHHPGWTRGTTKLKPFVQQIVKLGVEGTYGRS